MRLVSFLGVAVLLSALGNPAHSAILLDGGYDADYGAAKSVVAYDASAPIGNFGSPGTTNHNVGYSIFLANQGGTYYGLLRADSDPGGLSFANLYFDLDPHNGNGSDFGFEITNSRSFVPGMPGYANLTSPSLTYAVSADNRGIEFAISNSVFMSALAGLTYWSDTEFPGAGDSIVLRLSQSFGYSVAGGATYGDTRLGDVALGMAETPLPAALPLFATGLGALGLVGWRRRRKACAA